MKEAITSETVINRDYDYTRGLWNSPGKTEHAGVAKADVVCELSKMANCDLVNRRQQLLMEALKVTLSAEFWSKGS